VDGIKGSEASILPTALIRRATRRVLAQQSSVPKPWLGVEGEPIATLKVEQIQNHGWQFDRASLLADEHRGILLTSIMPGSPAALASFRAGDVILKVNGDEIRNADDFSSLLEQAGPSNSVRFTLARPNRSSEEAISVKLSGILDPGFAFGRPRRPPTAKGFSLLDQGIETIELKPAVAARLGATAGLLVIYVQPATAAFDSGLLPGDIIQAIDGKPVQLPGNPVSLMSAPGPYNLEIVRKKQKLNVTLINPEKEN
jgi:serine protease Do